METKKNYQAMTVDERQTWLAAYQQWLLDFSKVELQKTTSPFLREVFERGLSLLSAFNYCRAFVSESLRTKDYHRRLKIIRRFADRVTADVQKMLNQTIDLTDPALLVPHVGRPTKEEAAARALARQKEAEEKAKAPNLFNNPKDGELPAPSDDVVGDIASTGATVLGASASRPNRLPAIAEIRWLLSPALQTQTDTIRDLRSRFEEACTRAKQMAEDGRSKEDIAPYSQSASDLNEAIVSIYDAVDCELQTAYVRLKEDSAYIAKMSEISRMSDKELRSFLRPYWDKLSAEQKEIFKASVIEQIKANDPTQAAARKEAEEKKAKVNQIIKYLQRKDKPNTLKRIKGIEQKLAELRELIGDEADNYLPILTAAKEDYELNIRPQEEAAKAARQAAKETKIMQSRQQPSTDK